MPLTDLHNISLFRVLRYTARFGLNRSQGTYFHHTVQKSPPGTYLADLKHVSQPSSTSLLGRLLREACGTLPHLIPQELVCDNSQSRRRASCDIEMKHDPSGTTELPQEASVPPITNPSDQKAVEEPAQPPAESSTSNDPVSPGAVTLIRDPTSTPPATQPSFITLPAQLQPLSIPSPEAPLRSADTYQYPHPCWITNTRSSFITPIDSGNLPPQYLHYYTNELSEPIQQDDMDCLPPSPLPSSDVDMDILTDTAPAPPSYDHIPWTQWIQASEYAESPPSVNQSSLFLAPTPLYAPSFHAVTNMHWDAERNNLPWHTLASAAEPWVDLHDPNFLPTYYPGPLGSINVMSDRIQDTVGIRWQEQPHRGGTPHSASITALLEEFDRSLTLVADETSSSEVDRIALDSISDAGENILHDSPFERKAARSLGEGIDQTLACFLNLNNPPPPPFEQESAESIGKSQDQPPGDPLTVRFEREATESLEQDECRPPTPTLDQPRRPFDPVSLPPDTIPKLPVTRPAPHFAHPFVHPRPPTPPPTRSRRKSARSYGTRTNQHTTRQSAVHLATLDMERPSTNPHQDRTHLAQASVQASKRAQSGSGISLRPLPAWYGTREREEEEDGVEVRPAGGRRDLTKRTRFVMPNAEDDKRKDLDVRPRRTHGVVEAMNPRMSALAGSKNTRRTAVTEPPRSILRNARATAAPYQKAAARHAGRRASVP